jgi:hypothetical protein
VNNNFYFFSFKASGHHGHSGKGKHSRGEQKHHAQHQLKGDISKIENAIDIHPKNLGKDVAEHNKARKAHDKAHHNVLGRRSTKGHHHDRKSPDIDPFHYGHIKRQTKGLHNELLPNPEDNPKTDTTLRDRGVTPVAYAHAYATAAEDDNKHLFLILGITAITVLSLTLNKV